MGRVIPTRRRSRRDRWWVLIVLVVVAIVVVAAWMGSRTPAASPPPDAGPPTSVAPLRPPETARGGQTPAFDDARAMLERLTVKGWDRHTDFARYRFGESWSDDVNVEFGRNGCNTRDDVLRRDLTNLVVRPGTCYAQTGVLHDPYTGASIGFVRGPDTSDAVQIDHLVSLSDAWYKGARMWDERRRRDFANDPRNLLAVGADVNFNKAFRDAAAWLPPNAAFRCEFVARQIAVKTTYQLWVSANEKGAMAEVLSNC